MKIQKNQKLLKIKKIYDILNIINTTDTDLLILEQPNYNLNINDKIVIIDNIPNTNIFKNSIYYIIFIDVSYKQIKLGSLETKALVRISSNNTYPSKTVRAKIYKSIDYIKSELIDKSIKINYLQPYSKIIDKSYNENISIINNDINYINISNNSYYNFISSNLSIIQNTELYNLKWNTPYGTIRFKLDSNSIINYINIQYSNTSNNNVKRIHLYYYENDKVNYIGSINDIKLNNVINNSYNKNEYLIYFETEGLINNIYSELFIPNITIGFNNNINNIINNLNSKMISVKIDNIVNKYIIPVAHLDDNIINETQSLLLNNTKSSIIDINLDKDTSLKYYKIIQPVANNSIVINNQNYNNYYEFGKITSIQLFGSNNIDFTNEFEITNARYNNTTTVVNPIIEKTFINEYSFKYYRFKILNNFDYYPYTNTNIKNTNDILQYKFNTSISGFVVGDIKQVNYSNLYIEDINYINDVKEITDEYINIELKYDLLNSHLKGENIIISDTKISNNNFTTQNLIIYGNWYTRLFYKGFDTIYNYSKIQKHIKLNI